MELSLFVLLALLQLLVTLYSFLHRNRINANLNIEHFGASLPVLIGSRAVYFSPPSWCISNPSVPSLHQKLPAGYGHSRSITSRSTSSSVAMPRYIPQEECQAKFLKQIATSFSQQGSSSTLSRWYALMDSPQLGKRGRFRRWRSCASVL